jgi:hypothetical protein
MDVAITDAEKIGGLERRVSTPGRKNGPVR